jgi:hypothetical protein
MSFSTSLEPLIPFWFTWQHYDSILALFGQKQNKIGYVFCVLIPLALVGVYITFSVIVTKYQRNRFVNYYITDSIGLNSYSTNLIRLEAALCFINMIVDIFNTTLISYVIYLVKQIP